VFIDLEDIIDFEELLDVVGVTGLADIDVDGEGVEEQVESFCPDAGSLQTLHLHS
jgi:hypothetical protein